MRECVNESWNPPLPCRPYQQGCSCEQVQQDMLGAALLSNPCRAARAKFCNTATPCGKGVVFQFCLHWHNCSLPRGAVIPKSETCWCVLFCFKESTTWLKEQDGMWVAGNRSHFYTSSEDSSDFLPLPRVCCGLHRHCSWFGHRKESNLSFGQTSPCLLPVTVQNQTHQPSWCWTPAVLVRWDLGSC